MGTKPLAAVVERIFKDGRHDLGVASPPSTKTPSLQGRSGDSASMPNAIEVIGPSWAFCAVVQLSPRIACTTIAAPSVRSRVLVFVGPSASMARRGYRAPCSTLVTSWSITLASFETSSSFCSIDRNSCPFCRKSCPFFSAVCRFFPQKVDKHPPAWVKQTRILLAGGRGHCP